MPSCLIRGVRSVELATTNIEEAARFYENTWMLKPVETPPPFPPPLAGEGREGASQDVVLEGTLRAGMSLRRQSDAFTARHS
jgi:hypothetical protein